MKGFFLSLTAVFCFMIAGVADATHAVPEGPGTIKATFTKHFQESLFAITEGALFSVEIVTDEKEYKLGKDVFGIIIHNSKDEDVEGADVQAVLRRQENDRTVNVMLSVKEKGEGLYRLERFDLQMSGDLEIRILLKKKDKEDRVVFVFPNALKERLPAGKYDAGSH